MEQNGKRTITDYIYNIVVILWWIFVVVNYYSQYFKWFKNV